MKRIIASSSADEIDLSSLFPPQSPRRNCFTSPTGALHAFYISGEIKEPEEYIDWFHTIRNAGENDIIIFYINSPGGMVSSALQFISAMQDSSAQIMACVEGECMSAATMIFLSADAYQISEHSIFMFHNYRGGMIGKGGEMKAQVEHYSRWSDRLLRSVYKDFLTPGEIESILNNIDIWMDGDEIARRLEIKVKKSINETKKIMNQEKKKDPPKKTEKKIPVIEVAAPEEKPVPKKEDSAVKATPKRKKKESK